MPNQDDHLDNSRWKGFVKEHAQHFNAPVLDQMMKDIKSLDKDLKQLMKWRKK